MAARRRAQTRSSRAAAGRVIRPGNHARNQPFATVPTGSVIFQTSMIHLLDSSLAEG